MEVILRNGQLTAIASTHGAELLSLRQSHHNHANCDHGHSADSYTEYLWNGNPAYWPWHSPVLFPIVGSLKENQIRLPEIAAVRRTSERQASDYTASNCKSSVSLSTNALPPRAASVDGHVIHLSRHGFARDCEFSVEKHCETSAVFLLRASLETLQSYPYLFALRVQHKLTETGFLTNFSVTNEGRSPMPFCIGAHPGFCCPLKPSEQFSDYDLIFDKAEQLPLQSLCFTKDGLVLPNASASLETTTKKETATTVLPLNRKLFADYDTLAFQALRSNSVTLRSRKSGCGLRLNFRGFPFLALWAKPEPEASFLCIEPWHGCPAFANESGCFTDKPGCMVLEAGETQQLTFSVEILN